MKLKDLLKVVEKGQIVSVENITVNKGYSIEDTDTIEQWADSEVIGVSAYCDDLDITVK